MEGRIQQLDYLKGVFILLMVTFHLSLVESCHPLLRDIVYTFHMPAFLVLSGYFVNMERNGWDFAKNVVTRLAVPYLAFESLYLFALSSVGSGMNAHNALDHLDLYLFGDFLALRPLGPYWYLHTMVICMTVCYLIHHFLHLRGMKALMLSGPALYGLSLAIDGLEWSNVLFFLMGVYVSSDRRSILEAIPPSFLAVVPLAVLLASPHDLSRGALSGVAVTILVISLLLACYPRLGNVGRMMSYLGRNTMAIVVFSPIFTIVTKTWARIFVFDPTAVSFLVVSLPFVLAGCLGCIWLSDKLHLSHYVFGKRTMYRPFY